jgi:general secretion pathway protein K
LKKLVSRVIAKLRERPTTPQARNKQRGVALLMVLTWIALAVALVSEFSYGTSVDAAQAANARDELRAHYLARSSVNLARMLIKIQKQFVDPVMAQVQAMIGAAMNQGNKGAAGAGGQNASAGLGFSLRVTDYAGPLMGFFSGSKDEVAGLGSLIGIDTSGVKGLGLKSGHFDAEITAEDGKIDINCPGGLLNDETQKKRQQLVYRLLMGLMYSKRFDRLFSEAGSTGNFTTRMDVARAILDWADIDEQMFSPDGLSSGSGEDYRYDSRDDKYRAHNNAYDTVEELKMVKGVTDPFMEAFQPHLTVYANSGGTPNACKVNLQAISNKNGGDCTPLLMGVIRAAALSDPTKPPADPQVLDDTRLYPLASVLCDRASAGGFDSLNAITSVMANPTIAVMPDDPRYKIFQGMRPIAVDAAALAGVAYTAAPRVYKIVAIGEAGKVKKKITAIVDSARVVENQLTLNNASEKAAGVLQYWREE